MKLPDGFSGRDMSVAEYVARAMVMDEIKYTKLDFELVWANESEAWIANAESAIGAMMRLGLVREEEVIF